MQAYLAGLFFGLSLIVAIGAQNAFVLRQGLMRRHVFAVCLFCALSDAILIAVGVAGAGVISARYPWFLELMRWGGAAFLLVYGWRAFSAAITGSGALTAAAGDERGLGATMLVIAALTWLNPHVYLDTLALLGAVSTGWDNGRAFAGGAITGSFLFFFSLGYGARLLQPLFRRPEAWRVLDLLIAGVMWAIAASLVLAAPGGG